MQTKKKPSSSKAKTAPKKQASKADKTSKGKLFGVIFGLILFAIVVALAIFLVIFMKKALFYDNPRFALKEIIVETGGFWHGKGDILSQRLGLEIGQNLFEINPRTIRRKLARVPGIESSEVIRILPDQIAISIVERIPRAKINSPQSEWVVDEYAIAIPKKESMELAAPLPVILGVEPDSVKYGLPVENIDYALKVIMVIMRNFMDLDVVLVNIRNEEQVEMLVRFENKKMCRVFFPKNAPDIKFLIERLQSAIITSIERKDDRNTFDMTFDGRVIIK